MENFHKKLDKSIFIEMPKKEAFEYIKAKFGEETLKEVQEILKPYWKEKWKTKVTQKHFLNKAKSLNGHTNTNIV